MALDDPLEGLDSFEVEAVDQLALGGAGAAGSVWAPSSVKNGDVGDWTARAAGPGAAGPAAGLGVSSFTFSTSI